MSYTLSWISGCPNAWGTLFGMDIKGVSYESDRLNTNKSDHNKANYHFFDPLGKVPLLIENISAYEKFYPPHWRGQGCYVRCAV